MLNYFRGAIVALLMVINLTVMASIFLMLLAIKTLCPHRDIREGIRQVSEHVYHAWIDVNTLIFQLLLPTKWTVNIPKNLDTNTWYMLIANHCSGIDILILLSVFNRKIPHLKFFMKDSLKWVPFVGLICYALDYPMIKRYNAAKARKNKDYRTENIRNIEQACQTLKKRPTTIINFVEGRRYNPLKKQAPKNNPYKHLLAPQAGGTAMVLKQLNTEIQTLLDVTLCYQKGATLVDFICGNVRNIQVHSNIITIDPSWHGDFYEDRIFRRALTEKLQQLWQNKDTLLDRLHTLG